ERGEDHELQYRMMTANGREVWVRDIVTVVDGGTDAMMLRGLFIDTTILQQAEQKTRASQQRFRDIVETASDWIWECDADLRYTFVSERYTEMTGLPVEKVIGHTRQELSKGAQVDPGSDWESHFADLEAQRPFRDFRYNITAPSGDTLHFSISGTPVFDDSGGFAGYRGTGANTTAEMLAQAELIRHRDSLQQMVDTATADLQAKAEQLRHALEREKQLNEQQRQFISMASHEFRTPLAVIDGLVQRMIRRKDKLLPDELEVRANKIRGAVGTITTLMESTLTAARMDSGKININVGTIDLRRIIDEICRRQLLVDGNHKILRNLDGLPDTVIGDRGALDQVFTNLLSNAMKYSPGGTDVTVKGWCEGDTAIVTVQDKGLGIDEDDLPKMFTRFFRAKTSTGIPGTGIGLNLVKALIELHEGKISVQSRKGLGSIFTVQLPVNGPSHRERSGDRAA
ncbi:MAG: PAS domain-containing sensor histidine kinase, partial [Hyphomicrobiales bacterium]|nr:PAS domain-containing sensor histidine kinase [Hyphomicrobiales bacterium]